MGQLPSFYLGFCERLVCDVKQPFGRLPSERLRTATSGRSKIKVLAVVSPHRVTAKQTAIRAGRQLIRRQAQLEISLQEPEDPFLSVYQG